MSRWKEKGNKMKVAYTGCYSNSKSITVMLLLLLLLLMMMTVMTMIIIMLLNKGCETRCNATAH